MGEYGRALFTLKSKKDIRVVLAEKAKQKILACPDGVRALEEAEKTGTGVCAARRVTIGANRGSGVVVEFSEQPACLSEEERLIFPTSGGIAAIDHDDAVSMMAGDDGLLGC